MAGEEASPSPPSRPVAGCVCRRSELDLDVEALLALHDEHELIALLAPALLAHSAKRVPGPYCTCRAPSGCWPICTDRVGAGLAQRAPAPRVTAELPEDGLEPSPSQLDRAGRMDETIIGVDGSPESRRFLAVVGEHVQQALGSLDARQSGERPEDRPWLARLLELAPGPLRHRRAR